MININSYKEVCDDIFDSPNIYELPPASAKLIYVPLDQIDHFFKLCRVHPERKFVVVSGNSDFGLFKQSENPVNHDLPKRLDFVEWQTVFAAQQYCAFQVGPACNVDRCNITDRYSVKTYALTNSTFNEVPANVVNWFCTNCNIIHPKVTTIPFGLGKEEHTKIIKQREFRGRPKKSRLYINWQNYTRERVNLKEYYAVADHKFVTCEHNVLPLAEFYEELSSFQFCLCPAGNGLDCYRMWEALACGVYPIVEKTIWSENLANYFLTAGKLYFDELSFDKLVKTIESNFDATAFWSHFDKCFNIDYYKKKFHAKLGEL